MVYLRTAILVNTNRKEPYLGITPGSQFQKGAKWTPYLRPENLKNHTLLCSTYSLYMGVPPPPGTEPFAELSVTQYISLS